MTHAYVERIASPATPQEARAFVGDLERYHFARRFVAGKRVRDIASGAGWGSALLSETARSVVGVDIDESSIASAQKTYSAVRNLRFTPGSCEAIPLADASVDVA